MRRTLSFLRWKRVLFDTVEDTVQSLVFRQDPRPRLLSGTKTRLRIRMSQMGEPGRGRTSMPNDARRCGSSHGSAAPSAGDAGVAACGGMVAPGEDALAWFDVAGCRVACGRCRTRPFRGGRPLRAVTTVRYGIRP
jgi:hypothetical protein